MSGEVINGITFIRVIRKETGKPTLWLCRCHCGNEFETTHSRVKDGKTKSCGCKRYNKFIIDKYTYSSYNAMVSRCTNENNDSYYKYGAVGITVCERWLSRGGEGFRHFVEDMGIRPDGTSINRINSSNIYSKDTCEWTSDEMQSFDQKVREDCKSGISGVKYRKDRGVWISYIYVDKKCIQLYYGSDESEAILKRKEAEILYYGRYKNEG